MKRDLNRVLKLLFFGGVIFLPAMLCSIGWERQAIELAKAIPASPDFVYVGEFTTSYPSSLPGAGVTYHTDATRDEILDFYKNELAAENWEITKIDADNLYQSVPYIIHAQKDNWLCEIVIENLKQRQITINIRSK